MRRHADYDTWRATSPLRHLVRELWELRWLALGMVMSLCCWVVLGWLLGVL